MCYRAISLSNISSPDQRGAPVSALEHASKPTCMPSTDRIQESVHLNLLLHIIEELAANEAGTYRAQARKGCTCKTKFYMLSIVRN
jgi:hypothetical protein